MPLARQLTLRVEIETANYPRLSDEKAGMSGTELGFALSHVYYLFFRVDCSDFSARAPGMYPPASGVAHHNHRCRPFLGY